MHYFEVKNWEKFNHGHARAYPWLKLYKSLLYDYGFMRLSPTHRWVYIGLIILSGECVSKLPLDMPFLKSKLGMNGNLDLQPLFDAGFLVASGESDSSTLLAQNKIEKNKIEKSETSARTNVPFPEEWILGEEEFLYGLERYRLGKDVVRKEFERFKQYKIAHHATHRGQIGWDAAFRYWLGNVRVFDKTTPVTTPPRNPAPPAVEIKPEDRVRGQQVEELVARFVGKRSM